MNSFQQLDDYFKEKIPTRRSLNPHQIEANSFVKIETSLNELFLSDVQSEMLISQTDRILKSVLVHFPENIFWDFDFLIFRLVKNSKKNDEFRENLELYTDKMISIFEIFGCHSPIKFRYIHDFIYGFDWLKWMLEKKTLNESDDPFGFDFLNYIHNRGRELISLIKKNDHDYPDLEGVFRNPFLFARSTEEEIILLKDLSENGNIPIEAWRRDARPKSDQNYSNIRLERSKQIGIGKNQLPGSHKI